jgi:hypothetical protein
MTYREMLEAIALSDSETAEPAGTTNRTTRGLERSATIDAQDGARLLLRTSAGRGLERAFENSIKRLEEKT